MIAIYKITNIITKDFYIGSSVNFKYRKWTHLHKLRKNKHGNRYLQNVYNKYGEENLIFEVIELVDDKLNLISREQFYIDTLSPKYNLCKIAGNTLGYKHTLEARLNMRQSHLGIKLSAETINKRTQKVLGTKRSQITIERKRLAAVNKRPVLQFTLQGEFVQEWISISEAARLLNIQQSNINACCKNKRKSSGNFIWAYK